MKARIKHIIFTLCMLVSINQSIHIVSHIFSTHDSSKSELIHINEHKCQLCQINMQSVMNDFDFETFTWNDLPKQKSNYLFIPTQWHQIAYSNLYLRGPPYLI